MGKSEVIVVGKGKKREINRKERKSKRNRVIKGKGAKMIFFERRVKKCPKYEGKRAQKRGK